MLEMVPELFALLVRELRLAVLRAALPEWWPPFGLHRWVFSEGLGLSRHPLLVCVQPLVCPFQD